jgi:ferredoxin-NADP reductase
VYVCGSSAVNTATERRLLETGVPRRDVRIEEYDDHEHEYLKREADPATALSGRLGVEAR